MDRYGNTASINLAKDICKDLLKEKILAKETHSTVIRFAPPLIITKDQIDYALIIIKKVLSKYAN